MRRQRRGWLAVTLALPKAASMWGLWLFGLLGLCLIGVGCRHKSNKKPDPTKGVVTGIVLCADTGKPARFASVILTRAPRKDTKLEAGDPLPAFDETITDLDGRFRMEAVEPGQYYAYATLEGYLDPQRAIDLGKVMSKKDGTSQALEAIRQWKDHLVEVTVAVHRESEISITIERGGEIRGTVTFDDGSPAIGMHFQISLKNAKGDPPDVDSSTREVWSIDSVSDSHGRYSVSNLQAGEYIVCTLMPSETDDSAPRVCMGDTFRRKNAKPFKVGAGEVADGADIVIPLTGLHTVEGTVAVLADGHAPSAATVHLLYADDREEVRKANIQEDGSFRFEFVPEDKYLLRVTGANDAASKAGGDGHLYADKEIPLLVNDDTGEVQIELLNASAAPAPGTTQP